MNEQAFRKTVSEFLEKNRLYDLTLQPRITKYVRETTKNNQWSSIELSFQELYAKYPDRKVELETCFLTLHRELFYAVFKDPDFNAYLHSVPLVFPAVLSARHVTEISQHLQTSLDEIFQTSLNASICQQAFELSDTSTLFSVPFFVDPTLFAEAESSSKCELRQLLDAFVLAKMSTEPAELSSATQALLSYFERFQCRFATTTTQLVYVVGIYTTLSTEASIPLFFESSLQFAEPTAKSVLQSHLEAAFSGTERVGCELLTNGFPFELADSKDFVKEYFSDHAIGFSDTPETGRQYIEIDGSMFAVAQSPEEEVAEQQYADSDFDRMLLSVPQASFETLAALTDDVKYFTAAKFHRTCYISRHVTQAGEEIARVAIFRSAAQPQIREANYSFGPFLFAEQSSLFIQYIQSHLRNLGLLHLVVVENLLSSFDTPGPSGFLLSSTH